VLLLASVYLFFGRKRGPPAACEATRTAPAQATEPAQPAAGPVASSSAVPVARKGLAAADKAPVLGGAAEGESAELSTEPSAGPRQRVALRVLFGTTTGTARKFAQELLSEAPPSAPHPSGGLGQVVGGAMDCDGADAWDLLEAKDQDQEDQTVYRVWACGMILVVREAPRDHCLPFDTAWFTPLSGHGAGDRGGAVDLVGGPTTRHIPALVSPPQSDKPNPTSMAPRP